jgi:hypothetical protein
MTRIGTEQNDPSPVGGHLSEASKTPMSRLWLRPSGFFKAWYEGIASTVTVMGRLPCERKCLSDFDSLQEFGHFRRVPCMGGVIELVE